MNPTAEYSSSQSKVKYRRTSEHGSIHVALEHEGVGTVPSVYLSLDNGQSFTKLPWKLTVLGQIKQLFHALEWPPAEEIAEVKVEPGQVVMRCAQSNETDIVWREFRYDIARGVWRS